MALTRAEVEALGHEAIANSYASIGYTQNADAHRAKAAEARAEIASQATGRGGRLNPPNYSKSMAGNSMSGALSEAEERQRQQEAEREEFISSLNFPQYETIEQTQAALDGYKEKNAGWATDELSQQAYNDTIRRYEDQMRKIGLFEEGQARRAQQRESMSGNSMSAALQEAEAYRALMDEHAQSIARELSTEGAREERLLAAAGERPLPTHVGDATKSMTGNSMAEAESSREAGRLAQAVEELDDEIANVNAQLDAQRTAAEYFTGYEDVSDAELAEQKQLNQSLLAIGESTYNAEMAESARAALSAIEREEERRYSGSPGMDNLNARQEELLRQREAASQRLEGAEVRAEEYADKLSNETKWGEVLLNSGRKGLTIADQAIAKGLDFAVGGFLDEIHMLVGTTIQSFNPNYDFDERNWLTRYIDRGDAHIAAQNANIQAAANDNTAALKVADYATAIAQSAPSALFAILAAPAAATGAASTAALESISAIAQSGKAAQFVQPIAKASVEMMKNPQWLQSFLSTVGVSYEEALESGASEEDATIYAVTNAAFSASVEVGGADEVLGGLQKLPSRYTEALSTGKGSLALEVLTSMGSEIGEEVTQGAGSEALKNVYTDVPFLWTNAEEGQSAVIDPERMKEEAETAAVVSAVLGGSQMAAQSVINAATKPQSTAPKSGEDIILEEAGITPEASTAPEGERKSTSEYSPGVEEVLAMLGITDENGTPNKAPSKPQSATESTGDIPTAPTAAESDTGETGVLNTEPEASGESTEERTPGRSKVRPRPRTEAEEEYELETDAEALANEYLARAEVEREAGFIEAAEEHERKAAELFSGKTDPKTAAAAPAATTAAPLSGEDIVLAEAGIIPAAETPASAESSGASTEPILGGGTRTSRSAKTVSEADITTDSRRAELEPYIKNGRFDYVPDTNKRQRRRAEEAIATMGWHEATEAFKRDVAAGKIGKTLVARGAILLNNISSSDASGREYMDLVDSYIELMHNAGESLQAGKIIQQLTPEGRLYLITKTTNKINDSLTKGQRKAAAAQQGVSVDNVRITLDPKLIEQYASAETDAERDAIIEQMQADIARKLPASLGEKLNAWRYTAMLGNFKTQARNITGNAVSVLAKLAKDRVAAVIENAAQILDPEFERTRSVAYSPKLLKQAWADFAANKDAIMGEGKYTSTSQQFEKGIQDKRKILPGALEWWRKGTQIGMELGDAMFGRIAYADALAGFLNAHGTDMDTASPELLDRARAFAAKEAKEAVFRDNNAVSDFVTNLGKGWRHSDKLPAKVASVAAEGIVPFRKTPANVLLRAEEYSPLGIINSIATAVKADRGEATINDVINSVAKTATGSALTAAGYFLAMAGKLRGVEDDEELDKAQKANGAIDWSWVTDDGEYIGLSQFAPMTVPLFMGVRLAELTQGRDLKPKDAIEIIEGTAAPMLEMSMLSGLDNAFSDLSKYGDDSSAFTQFLTNAFLSYAQQYIPAIVGQIEQAGENYRQTAYTDSESEWLDANKQYALSKASAKIPGYDFQQTDYVDMWGRKTDTGGKGERILDAFINPTYTAQSRATEFDAALEQLHGELKDTEGAASVYPSFVPRSTKLGPNGETMSPEQYERYQIESGTRARELAEDFYGSPEWERLGSEQRAEVLGKLYDLADSQARKAIKAEMGVSGDRLKTDWDMEASLADPVAYLAAVASAEAAQERRGLEFDPHGTDAFKLYAASGQFSNRDLRTLAGNLGEKQQDIYGALTDAFDQDRANEIFPQVSTTNEYGIQRSDADVAAQIGELDLSDEEKFEALTAYLPASSKTGTIPTAVRRTQYAMQEGWSYDQWSEFAMQVILDEANTQAGYGDGNGSFKKAEIMGTASRMGLDPEEAYRIFSKASDYVDKTDESAIKPQQPRSKSKAYQYSPNDVYRLLGIE